MKGNRICAECGKIFSLFGRNTHSKYCSELCRIEIRRRVSANNRAKRKARMQGDDSRFIASQVHYKYKAGAIKRNLEFNLTVEYFEKHFRVNCHYCGDKLKNVGFDRVKNNKGYIESNVVPCCFCCNIMKRAQSKDDFIYKCQQIVNKALKGAQL